jgi:hypothetical protein
MPPLRSGTELTIPAKVLHAVGLGGEVTNYCLELPSGRTVWILSSQLEGIIDEDEGEKSVPDAPETKHVPGPPSKKAPAKAVARKRAPAA